MLPRPAPSLDPLFPRGHGGRLHDRREARWRTVDPPIGLLLTVLDNLVDSFSVLVQFQLQEKRRMWNIGIYKWKQLFDYAQNILLGLLEGNQPVVI